MPAKIVLKKERSGKFRFQMLNSIGKPLVTSEAYENRAAAARAVDSLRRGAADARLDDLTAPPSTATAKKTAATKTAAKKTAAKKAALKKS